MRSDGTEKNTYDLPADRRQFRLLQTQERVLNLEANGFSLMNQ